MIFCGLFGYYFEKAAMLTCTILMYLENCTEFLGTGTMLNAQLWYNLLRHTPGYLQLCEGDMSYFKMFTLINHSFFISV